MPGLVQVGIPEFEILATPAELGLEFGVGAVLVRAHGRDKFLDASFHEIVSALHVRARAVPGALGEIPLAPLAHASHHGTGRLERAPTVDRLQPLRVKIVLTFYRNEKF